MELVACEFLMHAVVVCEIQAGMSSEVAKHDWSHIKPHGGFVNSNYYYKVPIYPPVHSVYSIVRDITWQQTWLAYIVGCMSVRRVFGS